MAILKPAILFSYALVPMPLRRALSLLLAALLVVGCMNVSSTLTVRPDGSGTITERLTLNPEGNTITLLDLDVGTLARDSTAFRRLMRLSDDEVGAAETIDRLNTLPGMTVEPQETVTIRFR